MRTQLRTLTTLSPLALAFLSASFLAFAANPQAGSNSGNSTVNDAENWLTEKVGTFGSFVIVKANDSGTQFRTTVTTKLSFSGCRLELMTETDSTDDGPNPDVLSNKVTQVAQLGEFDAKTIDVSQKPVMQLVFRYVSGPQNLSYVSVATVNQAKRVTTTVQGTVGNYPPGGTTQEAGLSVALTDADIAKRSTKALADAINGCQGQNEKY